MKKSHIATFVCPFCNVDYSRVKDRDYEFNQHLKNYHNSSIEKLHDYGVLEDYDDMFERWEKKGGVE